MDVATLLAATLNEAPSLSPEDRAIVANLVRGDSDRLAAILRHMGQLAGNVAGLDACRSAEIRELANGAADIAQKI